MVAVCESKYVVLEINIVFVLGSVPDVAMEESVREIGTDIVMPKDTLSEEVITSVALTVEHLHVG